jgi:hypothetical protein
MLLRGAVSASLVLTLVPGQAVLVAEEAAKQAAPAAPAAGAAPTGAAAPASAAKPGAEEQPTKLPPEQLDSLVAPIALYPDPLLAQTLVASTYPLELVQLQQWLKKNKDLKDKALADAVAKEPWDPSIQTMAATPDVVNRLADDIQWTTDLGNAFLAQQGDVMDAVQRMRKKAKDNGALESNEQQKVETKKVEDKTIIVVESANPEVIYVPSYSPTVVYGPPVYPYPPVYYPPYVPGAAFVSFSFGVMMGAAFWGGSCCGCGWGGSYNNNVNINVNNNFNKINHNGGGRNGNWQHNPQHRGAAPYGDRATAKQYGGGGAGNRGGQAGAGNRGGPSAGTSDRAAGGAGNRGGPSAGTSDRSAGGAGSRGGASAGTSDRSAGGAGNRGASAGTSDRSGGSGSRGGGGFGGGGGYSGSSARSASSRGSSSMRSRSGGGGGGGSRRRR